MFEEIKLYYPFLINNNTPLSLHSKDIISYFLVADKVVIPTDHVFNIEFVRKNTDFIKSNNVIFELFKNGQIVTTTTSKKIRDYQDIIEQRTKIFDIKIPNFSVPIVYKDESEQRKYYADFFLHEFSSIKRSFYEKDKAFELSKFIKQEPNHDEVIKKIKQLNFSKIDDKYKAHTEKLIKIAYIKGGSDGNKAIIPTYDYSDNYPFYNDFYSLRFIRQFTYRFSKKLKINITSLNYDDLLKISHVLSPFKDEYYSKTALLKELEEDVFRTFTEMNRLDKYRVFKRTSNALFGYTVGALIEDFILPHFNLNYNKEFVLKIGLAYYFDKINLFQRIFRSLTKLLDQQHYLLFMNSKYGELIERFDNGLIYAAK